MRLLIRHQINPADAYRLATGLSLTHRIRATVAAS